MSNDEAKFVLGAYRPGGRDAGDATFQSALAQAKSDPALGAWFARAQAHDAAMAARLNEIMPPAGLREAILAGARASRAPVTARRFPTMWLALAASVAVLLAATVALWPTRAAAGTAQLTAFAVNDTAHGTHGSHGHEAGALQVMLSQPSSRLGAGVPVDFAALRATGCRTLNFAGHDVLEVCFQRDGAWFHCYIVKAADYPAMAKDTASDFEQAGGFGSASWTDGVHRFVVVSSAGVEAVKRLL
jgi:anti-sigma factor RsiW